MSASDFIQAERNWSIATAKGNELFHENNFQSAQDHYRHALFYSDLMLRSADEADRHHIYVASPFFVACLNMANNFWAMMELKLAGNYFFYNVWSLKMLTKRAGISENMYFEAVRNWQKAVLAFTDFYTQTNQEMEVDLWKEETYEQIQNTYQWIVDRKMKLN